MYVAPLNLVAKSLFVIRMETTKTYVAKKLFQSKTFTLNGPSLPFDTAVFAKVKHL